MLYKFTTLSKFTKITSLKLIWCLSPPKIIICFPYTSHVCPSLGFGCLKYFSLIIFYSFDPLLTGSNRPPFWTRLVKIELFKDSNVWDRCNSILRPSFVTIPLLFLKSSLVSFYKSTNKSFFLCLFPKSPCRSP